MPAHTVLFSSRAPIGYVAIAEKDVCTNQGFKSVIPNKDTDYLFLYYLLKYNKDNIENQGSGTTFKEVSGRTMRSVKVRVPTTIEEQRQIASVLSSLDDKIEKNTEINENLRPRLKRLTEIGLVEHIGRNKYVLARSLYSSVGKPGVHTRIVGLDCETNKELLVKHIQDRMPEGSSLKNSTKCSQVTVEVRF